MRTPHIEMYAHLTWSTWDRLALITPEIEQPLYAAIKEVKGSSSHLVTHALRPGDFFKWQGAYGAFSVGAADVPLVSKYITRQKIHHSEGSLTDE